MSKSCLTTLASAAVLHVTLREIFLPPGDPSTLVNNPAALSSPAVELRNIRKGFGPRTILDGIDLSIAPGEIFVLVGPSGSGKSTLLKIVGGIESPDEGTLWLSGRDSTEVPAYRRAIHTVFQNYALFPHLDVSGNVGFPLAVAGRSKRERSERVRVALDWVQLGGHAGRRIDTLSGGERQRVALARALVNEPECVLLDEPLSALDPHLRSSTLELLQEIQAKLAVTYLYITHDREEALRIGHRVGVLNHGRLEQVGTPEDVYHRPKTPFVASFLGKINWLQGEIVNGPGGRQIATDGGTLPLPSKCNLSFGRVRIGVRPEELHVNRGGWLSASVVSRSFLGDSVSLRLVLEDGTIVVADERPPFCQAAVGESTKIGWSEEAMHIFSESEA